MEGLKDCGCGKGSRRNSDSGEHILVTCVRWELPFGPILAVNGLEADRKAPGFILRDCSKKFERLITLEGGEVLVVRALRIQKASLASKAAPEIKGLAGLGHFVSDPIFSDEAGMVPCRFKELGVGIAPGGFRELGPEIVNLMACFILAGEDACSAYHADRGGHKGVLKHMAFRRETVEVGSTADLVSCETKGVVTKVIDEKEENVGPGYGRGEGSEQEEKQEKDGPHTASLSLRGWGSYQKRALGLPSQLFLTALIFIKPAVQDFQRGDLVNNVALGSGVFPGFPQFLGGTGRGQSLVAVFQPDIGDFLNE